MTYGHTKLHSEDVDGCGMAGAGGRDQGRLIEVIYVGTHEKAPY